jgi:hypothetical protein
MIIIWTLKVGGGQKNQQNFARDIFNEFAGPGCTLEVLVARGTVDIIVIFRNYTIDDLDYAWDLDEKLSKIGVKYGAPITTPYICSTEKGFSFVWASAGGVPKISLDFKNQPA